jgi:hypothetical protein
VDNSLLSLVIILSNTWWVDSNIVDQEEVVIGEDGTMLQGVVAGHYAGSVETNMIYTQ